MRGLVMCALALGAGIAIEGSLTVADRAAPLLLLLAAAATGVAGRRRPAVLATAVAVAALAAGLLAGAVVRARATEPPSWPGAWPPAPGRLVVIEGALAGAAEAGIEPGAWRAEVDVDTVEDADGERRPARARLLVRWRGARSLLPGDRVRARVSVKPPRGYWNPGAFDRERAMAARGVDGLASAEAPGPVRLAAAPRRSVSRLAAATRAALVARIDAAASGDGAGLLAALVLGERGRVRPALEDAFRRAGVSHVLSVSGLHLAAVALLAFSLVRRAWLRTRFALAVRAERVAAAVAAPAAIAYTFVTGAEVATVRSLWAVLAVLAAAALGRRASGATALAVAALAVLVASPWTLWDASFQLSFAAAAALVTLGTRLAALWPRPADGASRARRAAAWLWRLGAASLAAWIATAPITAAHFGQLQPMGLAANLVVVPAAELVVLPLGLLGALLAAVWAPLGAPVLALAAALAGALATLVGWLAAVAPVVEVPPPRPLELVALVVAVLALALLRPWRRALVVAAVCLAVVAAAAGVTRWREGARRDLVVTFLDVGQGDAAVIELPGGETWLVDAGGRLFGDAGDADTRLAARAGDPGEQAVWPYLRARRVSRLALVIVSHPHPDHVGGLAALAEHVTIDELWVGDDGADDEAWQALLADLARRGTRVRRPALGLARETRGVRAWLLAPPPAAEGDERSVNDGSLVVRVEYAGRAVLLTGDIEREGEAALVEAAAPELLVADVVKVPHHGSRTSSTAALVAATRPRWAVISCGWGNRFGFPAAEVVSRWEGAGAEVVRTDGRGAVTVRITPSGAISIRSFK